MTISVLIVFFSSYHFFSEVDLLKETALVKSKKGMEEFKDIRELVHAENDELQEHMHADIVEMREEIQQLKILLLALTKKPDNVD